MLKKRALSIVLLTAEKMIRLCLSLTGDEKPMIGPTIDGQIKVVYKSSIEGFSNHDDEFASMEAMGLQIGFQFGNMSSDCGRSASNLKTKKQKKTYYCYVCKIELNSEDTLISHMKAELLTRFYEIKRLTIIK